MRYLFTGVTFLLFALFIVTLGLFTTFGNGIRPASAATIDANGDLIIYDDSLTSGWLNWSWAATNMAYTTTVHSGTQAIQTDLDGWTAFSPFFSNNQDWNSPSYAGLATRGFDRLSFWVHRGESTGGQTINVRAGDILPGREWMHVAAFTVPTDDAWHEIVIPLSELDGVDTNLSRLSWNGNGSQTMPILIDTIKLLKEEPATAVTRDPIVNTAGQLWLYRDQRHAMLRSSWNAEIVHQAQPAASGAFALGVRFSWYGGLAFRPLDHTDQTPTAFQLQSQNVLRFLINRGSGDIPNQRYEVYALDAAGDITRRTPLEQYLPSGVFDEDIMTWQTVTVPLSALQPENGPQTPLYTVGIQEMSGAQTTTGFLYLDEIRFDTIEPSSTVTIYNDALNTAWQEQSWATTTNLTTTLPALGEASIAITHTEQWSGFHLVTDAAVSTVGLNVLRFQLHGGTVGGQPIRLFLVDATNTFHEASAVALTPIAGSWTAYEIPLFDLGNLPQIKGIVWQNTGVGAQAPYYLDNINLAYLNLPPTPTPTPVPGPALHVDAATLGHAINPHIYGMNFADEALAAELALPVRRWGGNGTTRYNYLYDTASHTSDWYFENIPKSNSNPGVLPFGSAADQFVQQDRRTGTATIMTMPMIGWTPKSREYACGFSVNKYGPQQSTDPWRTDCGNGIKPDGTFIVGNDPLDTSVPITETFVQGWMTHLIDQYGTAANGGIAFYNLDNEPMLWDETHRDVHPEPVGYDELRDLTYRYGAAIKAMDPTAETLGPAFWGWTAYFFSALDAAGEGSWWLNPQDRNAHGGQPMIAWYLAEMQRYETEHGVRILDYLDLHYYPQASGVALSGAGGSVNQAKRLRTTRSLWDPTYSDESWIAEPVRLIPRMRAWVDTHYPGTKLALTEYNWGALNHINGALAQADVLGIFGREGLDLATLWDPPQSSDPGAFAFRMYRNYDGNGSQFGEQSVMAASADQEKLSIYAALRAGDGALTVVVINKSGSTQNSLLTVSGFLNTGSAQVYRYSSANLNIIEQLPAATITHGILDGQFPKESITIFVLPKGTPPTVTPTPTNTATLVPTATPTSTPTAAPTEAATAIPTVTPSATLVPTSTSTQTPTEIPTEIPPTESPTLTTTPTAIAPARPQVTIAVAGTDLRLSWNSDPANTGFEIHHSHSPSFVPASGTLLGTVTADTTTYIDVDRLGMDGLQHYYIVRAIGGSGAVADSITMGAIAYRINRMGDQYTLIGIPFRMAGIVDAAALATHIGDVQAILKWNAGAQSFRLFVPPASGDNFPVVAGDAIFVQTRNQGASTASNSVTIAGPIVTIEHALLPGGFNFVTVPPQKETLVDAATTAQDIGGVTTVLRWNADTQLFRFFATPNSGDQFTVDVGTPLIVNLSSNGPTQWP